jgi:hypothetical protein
MPKSNQPAAKYRLGYVTASVWKSDNGFFNVTLQRSYKEGEEWKNSDSLGSGDLLNAAKVLQRAEEFIAQQ